MTKRKSKEMELKKYDGIEDSLDPRHLFSLTYTKLLCEALAGNFDLKYLAGRELANRGLDKTGVWVGFPKAKEIHGIQ